MKVRKIQYEDRNSRLWTWYKVIFMVPIWAVPIVTALGWALSNTPEAIFQAGHIIVILLCLVYFAEDLLIRSITVKDDILCFGFLRFKLSELQAIGMQYKGEGVLPGTAFMEFSNGTRLRLDLGRFKWVEFEDLLRHIENKVPQCKIDPVLLTLMKCKKTAGKSMTEIMDSVTIPYNSRRTLKELAASFISTADSWGKTGPVILSIFTLPCWLTLITALYLAPKASESIDFNKMSLNGMLMELSKQGYQQLGNGIQSAGTSFFIIVGNPIAAIIFLSVLCASTIWLVKTMIQPNFIIINDNKLTLWLNYYGLTLQVASAELKEITAARLVQPAYHQGPDDWILRMELHNQKSIDLFLSAITAEDRQKLLKALEKWAPHVVLDAELTEALLPKQERSYTELWLQSLTSAPERRSLEPLSPGQQLQDGRYEVIRCLGVGGQGTAYLCKDTSLMMERLNSYVVLKETIFPVFVDSSVRRQALERFEKEADLLSRFDSDNIVKFGDYFLEDHRGYLVLEHVDGKNLRQVIQERGKLSNPDVRDLARQMCDILALLHESGVVHRDFTPDNLILTRDGRLKLIDFNVAHQTESGSTGTIVGKHAFLPPEQFRGKATRQSDIYAMGATLFFLLTGQDPEPISQSCPREIVSDCDEALDVLVRTATNLDCKKRYESIEEVRVAVESEMILAMADDGMALSLEGQADDDELKIKIPVENEVV